MAATSGRPLMAHEVGLAHIITYFLHKSNEVLPNPSLKGAMKGFYLLICPEPVNRNLTG